MNATVRGTLNISVKVNGSIESICERNGKRRSFERRNFKNLELDIAMDGDIDFSEITSAISEAVDTSEQEDREALGELWAEVRRGDDGSVGRKAGVNKYDSHDAWQVHMFNKIGDANIDGPNKAKLMHWVMTH